jgi:hypothetical protein
MRGWLALLLLITNVGLFQLQSPGTDAIEINDLGASFLFGDTITFHARISPVEQIQDIYLYLQPTGEQPRTEKIFIDPSGELSYQYSLAEKPIRPFADVSYWLRVVNPGGSQIQSEKKSFNYEDNRFTWQALDDANFQVRWISGDLVFGQAVLNAAQRGLQSASSILNVKALAPIKIIVYANSGDLQTALSIGTQTWIAGRASPDLNTIIISIAPSPEQELELDRQLSHELTHILTYAAAGTDYQRLPFWLIEGLASLAETTPNPDYKVAITQAEETNTLLPFTSLCNAFPSDASGAFLSYAESASFVQFLYQKFGSTVFPRLIKSYQNGLGCEEGFNATLGSSLEQMDVRWQQERLGIDTSSLAIQNLAPYLISALILICLPLGYSISNRKKANKAQSLQGNS